MQFDTPDKLLAVLELGYDLEARKLQLKVQKNTKNLEISVPLKMYGFRLPKNLICPEKKHYL